MKHFKLQLLGATAIAACGVASTAQAQVVLPAVELRGVGATSIQNILVESLNCIGNPGSHAAGNTDHLNQLGANNGNLSDVAEGKFTQTTTPTPTSPDHDCDLQEIQPNFQGKYVGTGSGTGRKFWSLFTNQLPGTNSSNINPFGTWNNVQFAFSDAPLSSGDLTAYTGGANSTANKTGAAIQFPLYVLPVAIAMSPTYALFNSPQSGRISLSLRLAYPKSQGTIALGGLRLTKDNYCQIFNGVITNFNDPALTASNNNLSLRDTHDSPARWASVGLPIRLVGRLDSSGTTDVFSRHLAQVCTGRTGSAPNKFVQNAEALPYDNESTIDLRAFRSDTRYFPGSTGAVAGTIQSLSGAVFVRGTGSTPGHIDTTQGAEAQGLFMVADGSGGVRDALNFLPDPGTKYNAIGLNGKIGYIGGDFVAPAPGAQLVSAQLQVGTSGVYAMPNPTTVLAAFGGILPPQTTSTSGAWDVNDTRTGPHANGSAGTEPIDRANPLHWTSVLYSNSAQTLANPTVGYPMTGTTQFLGYTCYASEAKFLGVAHFLSEYTGRITKDSTGAALSTALFNGTIASKLGLVAQSNLAPVPVGWQTAIFQTFLNNATTVMSGGNTLGSKNLWIQNFVPTLATQVDGNTANGEVRGNPTCTVGKGG